jgi:hypothetical protein
MSLLKTLLKDKGGAELVSALIAPPIRDDPAMTTFRMSGGYKNGKVHQMDVLFLPEDTTGDRYLLVVVDIGSGKTDAVPLKKKSAEAVMRALQTIYGWTDNPDIDKSKASKYLKVPKYVHMDAGGEFNNTNLLKFLRDKKIGYRVASTNRHKQMAVVEQMNARIGGVIERIQLNDALSREEGDDSEERDWIAFLPDILEAINSRKMPSLPDPPDYESDTVNCQNNECDTYMVGDKVRVLLDYPQSIKGARLHGGSFRSGDIRWSLKPYIVRNVLLAPGQPIRYVAGAQACNNDGISKKSPFYKDNCPLRNTFSKYELKAWKEFSKPKEFKPKFEIRGIKEYGQNPNPRKTLGERDEPIYRVQYKAPFNAVDWDKYEYRSDLTTTGGLSEDILDEMVTKAKKIELDSKKAEGKRTWARIKRQDAKNKKIESANVD